MIRLHILTYGFTGCTATTISSFLSLLKSLKESLSMTTISPERIVGSMDTPSALLMDIMFFSTTQYVVTTGMTLRQVNIFFSIQIISSLLSYIISECFLSSSGVVHIGALVVTCQAVISAKITGQIVKDHKIVYMLAGIFVIISGLVNTYLLNPQDMGEKRKLWVGYHHLKLLTSILIFTPLVKVFPFSTEARIDIQFYWMIVALLLSPFARFYREHFVAREKERRQKQIKEEETP